MWFKRSRAFALSCTSSPRSQAIRETLGHHDELGPASAAWHARQPDRDGRPSAPSLAAQTGQACEEATQDRAYQTFLNPATSPGAITQDESGSISAESAKLGTDHFQGTATRAITSFGGHGELASASALLTPYGTGIKVGGELGESHAELSGLALVGKKTKTLGLDTQVGSVGAGIAATLVTDSKIAILGPVVAAADGSPVRLARFQANVMPVIDIGVSGLSEAFGIGARAVFALGRGATYDKFVAVDQLSAMMRQRAQWCRPGVETLAALGVMAGLNAPSRRNLAAEMGRIDAMLPGEAVTWRSTGLIMLGLAAGSHGLRATLTGQLQGHALMRLARLDGDAAELTVQPIKIVGIRAGAEARLIAEVAAEAHQAAAKTRSWRFDLTLMSSRHALYRALRGELPGLVLSGNLDSSREAFALLTTHMAEKLPVGVTATGSEFISHVHLAVSLNSLRLPEFVGGASLGASVGLIRTASGMVDSAGSATFTRDVARVQGQNLLTAGSLDRRVSASVRSAVSIGPRGEREVTPLSLDTAVSLETTNSARFGRNRVTKGLAEALGRSALVHAVRPTKRYAVEIVRSLGVDDLGKVAGLTANQIDEATMRHQLKASIVAKVMVAVRQAVSEGSETAYAHALEAITALGARGVHVLTCLAHAHDEVEFSIEASVSNESHDQLLKDFFKAETYALGAKTFAHARSGLERLVRLEQSIRDTMDELRGDGVMEKVLGAAEIKRRCEFLSALRGEVVRLAADVTASMGD